jgi:Calx-beta domain
VRVGWRTVNNSATAPSDFAAATGTATFAPGDTETSIPIEVRGDDVAEGRELVLVAFENAENATVGGWLGLGFVFIDDDDGA